MKEAAGALTGDQDLKDEGKADQAVGSLKDRIGDVADKLKGMLDRK